MCYFLISIGIISTILFFKHAPILNDEWKGLWEVMLILSGYIMLESFSNLLIPNIEMHDIGLRKKTNLNLFLALILTPLLLKPFSLESVFTYLIIVELIRACYYTYFSLLKNDKIYYLTIIFIFLTGLVFIY